MEKIGLRARIIITASLFMLAANLALGFALMRQSRKETTVIILAAYTWDTIHDAALAPGRHECASEQACGIRAPLSDARRTHIRSGDRGRIKDNCIKNGPGQLIMS